MEIRLADRLESVLWDNANGILLHKTPKAASTTIHRHLLHLYKNILVDEVPVDHIAVAIVRNPMDRIASCYRDKIFAPQIHVISANPTTKKKIPGFKPGMLANDFVEIVIKHHDQNRHWMPQSQWLDIGYGLPIHIVHFERLSDEWKALQNVLALPDFPNKYERRTQAKPWQEYINEDQAKRIRALWSADFVNFGYEA